MTTNIDNSQAYILKLGPCMAYALEDFDQTIGINSVNFIEIVKIVIFCKKSYFYVFYLVTLQVKYRVTSDGLNDEIGPQKPS